MDEYEDDYDVVPYNEEEYYRNEQEAEKQNRMRRFYGETISSVLNAVTEYAKTLEREKSNLANIERKRKTAITVLKTEKSVLLDYLKARFSEHGDLFEKYFKLIETALQINNEEILRIALESIQNIYQDNPCVGIDEFKQQFDSMSEVIRI